MSTSGRAASTWAPLRVGIFRALWLAVNQPHASLLVALVQTVDMLPDVLLAYVGGVLADTFDRRWLLIVVQGCLVLTGLIPRGRCFLVGNRERDLFQVLAR